MYRTIDLFGSGLLKRYGKYGFSVGYSFTLFGLFEPNRYHGQSHRN